MSEMVPDDGRPIQEHHLIEAVKFAAYVVLRYGDVYAPTFERLETELAAARRSRSVSDRARMALAAYTLDGGVKAIL